MLRVIQAGLFSTIQDTGRAGFRSHGVPISGPFDRFSALIANALLGNPTNAAVIEMTLSGGTFEAESQLAIALSGAPMPAAIESPNGGSRPLGIPQSFTLHEGDRLILGTTREGVRTYMAVTGGWLTPQTLGSRCLETPLKSGDVLPAESGQIESRHLRDVPNFSAHSSRIRYVAGPDFENRITGSLDDVPYTLDARSSRMGLRTNGPSLELKTEASRMSSPVSPGAIQMPAGVPLILGPACGTMGGYPHIGHVVNADLDQLGQARPGANVRFQRVDLSAARRLDQEYRRALRECRLRLASFAN